MTDTSPAASPSAGYDSLRQRFARIGAIANGLGVLHWDQETMMPDGAAGTRADALAVLEVLRHESIVDPAVGDALDAAEGEADGLAPWDRANLREMRRQWRHATAVPADLVGAASHAVSLCQMTWREARRDDDFAALLPSLRSVLDLTRQIGETKAEHLGLEAYDALLDGFEPDMRSATVDRIFADLAAFLPDFIDDVLTRQKRSPAPQPIEGPFPVSGQRALCERLIGALGFDFARGRLDISAHPFCGGADNDVRITTRYDEQDFFKAMMATLHECGHALYEQGRPQSWLDQPVGAARSTATHESQSLLVEMQVCRSRHFLAFAAPLIAEAFGRSGAAWSTENLYRHATMVEPGFIRVDADEVTYPAHVILRYRLERDLLSGQLDLADLPDAWNSQMQSLLGLVPPDDRLGCLQDIHWPCGAWGYFPTYTLGAIAAAQLRSAAEAQDGTVMTAVERGDFSPLMTWIRANVHRRGSFPTTDQLMVEATGRPLDVEAFKAHLRHRYLDDA